MITSTPLCVQMTIANVESEKMSVLPLETADAIEEIGNDDGRCGVIN